VFTLLSYRLMQRGPSFPETVEVALDRKTGSYKARSARDGKERESSGSIELPPDVYNGMAPTLLKNLAHGASETVHVVAFAPKPRLARLSPEQITASELAGERITALLTTAPGNNASIGGLKVVAPRGWFAARPSGTEDVYKLYAESFKGSDHLRRIQEEAMAVIQNALRSGP